MKKNLFKNHLYGGRKTGRAITT